MSRMLMDSNLLDFFLTLQLSKSKEAVHEEQQNLEKVFQKTLLWLKNVKIHLREGKLETTL